MVNLDNINYIWTQQLPKLPEIDVIFFVREDGKITRQILHLSLPTAFDNITISAQNYSVLPAALMLLGENNSTKAILRNLKNSALNQLPNLKKPKKSSQYLFDTRSIEADNLASLMILILPFCLKIKQILDDNVAFIFKPLSQSHENLLRFFGIIPIQSLHAFSGNVIKVNLARRLAQFNFFDANMFDSVHNPALCFVDTVYDDFKYQLSPQFERIFIGQKNCLNLDKVSQYLEGKGYKTIFLNEYSTVQQLAIISDAKHIVAVHNEVMGLFVINQQLDSIIEILPPNVHHEFFPIAINRRVKKYIQIMSNFDARLATAGWAAVYQYKITPYNVDLELLEKALHETK